MRTLHTSSTNAFLISLAANPQHCLLRLLELTEIWNCCFPPCWVMRIEKNRSHLFLAQAWVLYEPTFVPGMLTFLCGMTFQFQRSTGSLEIHTLFHSANSRGRIERENLTVSRHKEEKEQQGYFIYTKKGNMNSLVLVITAWPDFWILAGSASRAGKWIDFTLANFGSDQGQLQDCFQTGGWLLKIL